ncbi:hypothetical protein F4774DRAFT_152775 [Daldinia eschscholtzii]|nr:hypothetical protein F4774DRAFT_152775 [Daldinia eschscholtzii]
MDNSSANNNGNNNVGNTGMDSATLAGVVSTVISFLALIVSSIQLLYQYYTNVSLNALGARNCNKRVMGPWAKFTRRRWRWLELRYEIIFESPIIFVAPAWNQRGPIPGREIWYMSGSDESFEETRTPMPVDSGPFPRTTAIRHGVNVEATWVLLLRTLQSMERDSAKWLDIVRSTEDCEKPLPFSHRTLAIAVQAQTLSWDFVPNFKKPFANTTICHMVELAAMLGIYWTMWDATVDRYRAEGNGCMLLGSFNAEQGIVFKFVRHDRTEFREHRLIPSNIIKRLCFGFAPTFYFLDKYDFVPEKGEREMATDPILPLLRLGSRQEIVETLMDLGCPIPISEHFLNEDARISHLFPIVFDVLGMLGRTISVEGYCYRFLPNPTIFRWDRRWFKTKRLLLVFKEHLSRLNGVYAKTGDTPEPLLAIASALERLSPQLENPSVKDYSPALLDSLRRIMTTVDRYLKHSSGDWESPSEALVLDVASSHVASLVTDLGRRPSWFVDLFPLRRADDGVNEHTYITFLFQHSRRAAVEIYGDLNGSYDSPIGELKVEAPPPVTDLAAETDELPPTTWRSDARIRDATWCLLVFRMLCWLQLHDFHRDDIMIPRSTTYGSRMPVYIV